MSASDTITTIGAFIGLAFLAVLGVIFVAAMLVLQVGVYCLNATFVLAFRLGPWLVAALIVWLIFNGAR